MKTRPPLFKALVAAYESKANSDIARILSMSGYAVLEARSGAECLNLAREAAPGLIITDFIQDKSDGQDLILAMKSEKSLTHTSLILLIDRALQTRVQRTEVNYGGFCDLLSTPFAPAELMARVRAARKLNEVLLEVDGYRSQLAEMKEALLAASKMASLGEMASGLAHEINNPLAIIKTQSSLLQELISEEPFEKDLALPIASNLEKTADRIAKIVQALRTFSRNGDHDEYEDIDLEELISEVASLCQDRLRALDVELHIDGSSLGTKFRGRATEISQVLVNLVGNAGDAVAELPERWVRISAMESENSIEIRITDSGKGIPSEIREKIFQPFFTTKGVKKGTGLGLSISFGIIQRHHGKLSLDEECPNTCFVIRLPKKPEQNAGNAVDRLKGSRK